MTLGGRQRDSAKGWAGEGQLSPQEEEGGAKKLRGEPPLPSSLGCKGGGAGRGVISDLQESVNETL